ncbi:MAG: hypothetical protein M0R51_12200 [Clostridia bacterium]|jgi:hypothetical protein|nr:hypothetical protein [Clostridia bacterium]
MTKVVPLQNKFFKRTESFKAVVSEIILEDAPAYGGGTRTDLVINFEGEEPSLRLDMKLDKWVDNKGVLEPKKFSIMSRFLESFKKFKFAVEFNTDYTEVATTPDLVGKECSFTADAQKFIPDPKELDAETMQPREVTFYVWKLAGVEGL